MDKTDGDSREVKENNIQNFSNSHQQLMAADLANLSSTQPPHEVLKLDALFEFLEKHFDIYQDQSNLNAVLPLIHLSIRLFARRDYLDHDIGMILLHFYEDHKEDENDLIIFIQILHQVLHSLDMHGNKEIMFCRKVFVQLVKQLPELKRQSIVPNISVCLQLFLKMYPDNKEIFEILWTELSQRLRTSGEPTKIGIEILVQFIDDFFNVNPNLSTDIALVKTIQSLLKSNMREERKSGYFLFKKMVESFITSLRKCSINFMSLDHGKQVETMWINYITILENLEENQSHLILPSLKNLNELIESKQMQFDWLKILYHKILSHKNSLVLRWSIEFFMNKFSSSSLDNDTLRILLESLNSNILYNYEGYFIDEKYYSTFLQGDLSKLYIEMAEINWKSVPLCHLLFHISTKCEAAESMSFELVLKIAARIRRLTDIRIREKAAKSLCLHLRKIIDEMSLEKYVTYIETLLTASNEFDIFKVLFTKKIEDVNGDNPCSIFQRSFYEIAVNNLVVTNLETLISFLEHMPVKQHGWLSFLTFHFPFDLGSCHDDELLQKQKKWYGINLRSCGDGLGLDRYNTLALRIFSYPTMDELEQCKIALIAVYINSLNSLDDLGEEILTQILLVKLPDQAVRKLCGCLDQTTKVLESWAINKLIDYISNRKRFYNEYLRLQCYLEKNKLYDDHIKAILEKCPTLVKYFEINILKFICTTDFFCGDVKKGESRIEECYRYNFVGENYVENTLLEMWYYQLSRFGDNEYVFYLLNCHKEISRKKQRYFANSHEHRLKMRIAVGIIHMANRLHYSESLCDEFWYIVLNENNQPSITYVYEYLIATKDKREDLILQKLNEKSETNLNKSIDMGSESADSQHGVSENTSLISAFLNTIDDSSNDESDKDDDCLKKAYMEIMNFSPKSIGIENDLMQYWEEKKYALPHLYQLAKVVHSVPATQAHKFTSSQQISIMSIVYTYLMRVGSTDKDIVRNEQVVSNLLCLTMGANFHTRLFAQKVLWKLQRNEHFFTIQKEAKILYAIRTATMRRVYDYLKDIRLSVHEFEPYKAGEIIRYATNAPYDETLDVYLGDYKETYHIYREWFFKKLQTYPKEENSEEVCHNQLQRKMNPSTGELQQSNLIIYPAKENSAEMYVIASLIDKLPNLGCIARTCEVLGIRNIVMDSKSDSEKNDFKNLSMTSEKSLNIIEVKRKNLRDFIISKRKEGFAVVGAEQTSNSENFAHFKFPPKCILLLGHEKEGIPPTLLGLLDHAVEVPQFGQVRSLNVHVTGALFMWEFCKQHLAQ